jgi:nucleoside-diphosphate kinase
MPAPISDFTLVLIKPDAVKRGLVGEILARYEHRGLAIVAMARRTPDEDTIRRHYAEHANRPDQLAERLVAFMAGVPLVALVLCGPDAIAIARATNGATDPVKAAPGTIRGDFGNYVSRNLVHASDGAEAAAREIALWFPKLSADALVDDSHEKNVERIIALIEQRYRLDLSDDDTLREQITAVIDEHHDTATMTGAA